MGPQGVLFRGLGRPLGVINIKDDVPFAHIKIPGDHRGGVHNLNENLDKEILSAGNPQHEVWPQLGQEWALRLRCVSWPRTGQIKWAVLFAIGHSTLDAYLPIYPPLCQTVPARYHP